MPRSTWVRFCAIVHLSNFYENGHPCCRDWCSPWYCLPASLLVPYNGTEESVSKQKEDSTQPPTLKIINHHTYAKLIEIQKIYLQKIHGLHELGGHMECNDKPTLV